MNLPKIKPSGINFLNLLGALVAVYLLVVLGQTVKRNYDLGRQNDELKIQISQLQDQKDQLAFNLQYYGTNAFRDREARSKLGLQLPGENVVIIPRSTTPATTSQPAAAPAKKSNFLQWFDFLIGRS